MTWRGKFRPIIARVLEDHAGQDEAAIKRALRDAYPAQLERAYWPYRVWLDEIARQRGKRLAQEAAASVVRQRPSELGRANRRRFSR